MSQVNQLNGSILQIILTNPIREGVGKLSGNPYRMQDCECIILNDDGTPREVGVLMLGKELVGNVTPGTYLGQFALRANKSEKGQRRIEAVITGLTPYAFKGTPAKATGGTQ